MFSFRMSLLLFPLILALLPVIAFFSVFSIGIWNSLGNERALAKDIQTYACSLKNSSISDASVRRFVQERGQQHGIDIKFQDVIISYISAGGVEKLNKIGYALPIEVTFFGMWTFHMFSHREYPLCLNQNPNSP